MDRIVRMSCVIAVGLWVLSVVTVLLGTIALIEDHADTALALYAHAVLVIAAAATSTVKHVVERNTRLLLDGMKVAGLAAGHLRQID